MEHIMDQVRDKPFLNLSSGNDPQQSLWKQQMIALQLDQKRFKEAVQTAAGYSDNLLLGCSDISVSLMTYMLTLLCLWVV
jgi:hypothetical protein